MIPIGMPFSRSRAGIADVTVFVLSFVFGSYIFAQELNLSPIGVVDMEEIFTIFPEESQSLALYVALRAEYGRNMQSERNAWDDVILELLDAKLDGDERRIRRKQQEEEDRRENYRALDDYWRRRLREERQSLAEDPFFVRFEKAVEFVAIDNKFIIIAEKGDLSTLFDVENALYRKSLFAYTSDQVDVTEQIALRIRRIDN